MSLRVGGLFAGYGGLELGLSQVLDCHPAWFSEVEPAPCAVLAHRYPGVPNLGDITKVDWSAVEPVEIATGGFPCQDLSPAGKQAGLKPGTRSGLWSHMAYAIGQLRPRLVVIENVRGLLSAEADSDVEQCPWCVGGAADGEPPLRALGAVLADLAELGYDAAWTGLRAADVGAPHGRFRVFVLAWPAQDTEGPAGGERRLAAPGQAPGGRARADAGRPDRAHAPGPQGVVRPMGTPEGERDRGGDRAGHPLTLLPTPAVNDMGAAYTPEQWDAWTERMKTAHGNGNGHGPSLHIEALRMLPKPVTAYSATSADEWRSRRPAGNGGEREQIGDLRIVVEETDFGPYAPAVARWEAILGRPAPAPTEPTGKGGAHRLSARFVEFLMGLPDGWVTDVPGVTRNHALKALGNGCVPQQVAAAVTHLLEVRRTHALVA